jgi:Tfp pilus assembly protein FimV
LTAALLFGVACCWPVHAEPALPPVLLPNAVTAPAPVIAASAQPGYRVQRGDSLDHILMKEFGLARAALKQWRVLAVAQNPAAFKGGNPNRLIAGALLAWPQTARPPAPIIPPVPTTPEQPRAPIYYYGH